MNKPSRIPRCAFLGAVQSLNYEALGGIIRSTWLEQPTSPAPTHEISGKTSNNLITSTPGPMKSTIMIKPLHLSGVSEISSSESELGRNSVDETHMSGIEEICKKRRVFGGKYTKQLYKPI